MRRKTFRAWLATQPTYAQTRAAAGRDVAAGQASYAVCSACHGQQGEGNPQLERTEARRSGGLVPWRSNCRISNSEYAAARRDTFGKQMVAFAAMLADDTRDRRTSLRTSTPCPSRIRKGRCRGILRKARALRNLRVLPQAAAAKGVWSTNAPRLSPHERLVHETPASELQQGVRGSHPEDFMGAQMAAMAKSLADDQAINDVLKTYSIRCEVLPMPMLQLPDRDNAHASMNPQSF